ncbi:MAG TPA: OmpA family protein, partial [Kofleriaceae bacterium]|nr:OmpA family protein [Kofleriaceae bacterium]
TTVAHAALASGAGNHAVQDYDLVFTADAPFSFPGGGLIIRVAKPLGPLATRTDQDCLKVITADALPTGTNRLIGTFQVEVGEYPWTAEATTNTPGVPYVRIAWTRCGDGRVSGAEACDDGNTDDTDDCTNRCLVAACGDGVVARTEECDNSATPDHPDPFCNDSCQVAAFAKGSGCGVAGGAGGAGLAIALVVLVLARRRRAAGLVVVIAVGWTAPVRAQVPSQRRTDGFRVDRFEMAPSVEDGLIVQDPSVLGHLNWSVNGTLGFTNTLLRVVPRLSSNDGVDVVGPRLSAYLDLALGLGQRFELNLALPFAVAQASESGTAAGLMLRSAGTSAVGDARLGGSVLLYGRASGPQFGLAATLALPIGSENSFTSDGKFGGEALATGGYAGPGYRVMINGGVRFRPETNYVSSDQGTELIARAGVFVPVQQRVMTSLELDAMVRAAGRDSYTELGSPILAILGARYHFPSGLRAGAGVGAGLTEAPGSPAIRVLVTVGYSPEPTRPRPAPLTRADDSDGDGIPDDLDKCPSQPEDKNGIEDDDGCPDSLADNDRIDDLPPDPHEPLTLEQVVTLPAPIEFKFDTAIMLPGAEIYLNQVLDILQKHPEVLKLEIQGHTSSEGGAEYNLRLSNDRAKAVYTWLVDRGIDGARLVPHGYGLTLPIRPNDTEPHRQRNRRVQFRLLEQVPGTPPLPSNAPPPATPPATAPPATAPPATPPPQTPPPAAPPPAAPR